MYGKTRTDLIIKVPVGTQVRDVETGKLLLDMNVPGEPRLLLKGGEEEQETFTLNLLQERHLK